MHNQDDRGGRASIELAGVRNQADSWPAGKLACQQADWPLATASCLVAESEPAHITLISGGHCALQLDWLPGFQRSQFVNIGQLDSARLGSTLRPDDQASKLSRRLMRTTIAVSHQRWRRLGDTGKRRAARWARPRDNRQAAMALVHTSQEQSCKLLLALDD